MKHFTFRLFLIRKLIESLMASCIDEYTEFEEIADGLAKAHSAMEKRRKTVNVDPEPEQKQVDPPDPELVEACRRIIGDGDCNAGNVYCESSCKPEGTVRCPNCDKPGGDKWACNKASDSARHWLAEHGIKE